MNTSRMSTTRAGQLALGVLWIVDGLLKLQPYFFRHFATGVIAPNASGQPVPVGPLIHWVAGLVAPAPAPFVVLAAGAEILIGTGLLVPRTVKPALAASFAWALNVWLVGEGLGGVLTSSTPAPLMGSVVGTMPLYLLAGLLVWPGRGRFGLLGERGARAAWAALWLLAAALWLFPSNSSAGAVSAGLSGAPAGAGFLSGLQGSAASAVGRSGMTVALVMAVVSAEIGLSVLWLRGTRAALIAGMCVAALLWVLGEGFGGLLTGQATDVGNGPLVVLIAFVLLPLGAVREREPAAALARVV